MKNTVQLYVMFHILLLFLLELGASLFICDLWLSGNLESNINIEMQKYKTKLNTTIFNGYVNNRICVNIWLVV